MASFRCGACNIAWPIDLNIYRKCPSCLGRTFWSRDTDPLTDSEAWTLKCHYEFDRFLVERDKRRQQEFERVVDGVKLEAPDDEQVVSD